MNRAIDVSNYGSIPTAAQVRCLLDAGYTTAIVGTSYGSIWWPQIAAFAAGGMDVQEYQFPLALRQTARPWWLDAETPEATVATMREILTGTNPPIGIYTRRTWWTAETGDWHAVDEFPWLQLWDASYGDPPPAYVSYGGWSSRVIHQWHDTTTLCGVPCDLNIIEEADRMYTDSQIDAKVGAVLAQQGALGVKIDALKASVDYLAQIAANLAPRVTKLEGK